MTSITTCIKIENKVSQCIECRKKYFKKLVPSFKNAKLTKYRHIYLYVVLRRNKYPLPLEVLAALRFKST